MEPERKLICGLMHQKMECRRCKDKIWNRIFSNADASKRARFYVCDGCAPLLALAEERQQRPTGANKVHRLGGEVHE